MKLKPCPFCGGEPQIETHFDYGKKLFDLWCTKCRINISNLESRKEAITAWNKRTKNK